MVPVPLLVRLHRPQADYQCDNAPGNASAPHQVCGDQRREQAGEDAGGKFGVGAAIGAAGVVGGKIPR